MEKIKISIILPIYNSEKVIKRTIESIIKQTYENIELIIINDGSTDSSGQICKEYARQNNKITYVEINNKGVSNARNIGIQKATGNYIMFIDSDDEYYENAVEKVAYEIKNKKDLELVVFGYDRIHVNTNKVKKMRTYSFDIKNGKDKNLFIEKLQKECLFNQIWNKAFKKTILTENDIKFDTSISSGEDYKFNIQYIASVNNAIYIDEILYKYYSGEEGLSLKTGPNKIYVKLDNLKEHRKLYKKMNYDFTYIDNNYVYTCLSGLTAMKIKNNSEKTSEYLKKYIENKEIRKELENIKNRTKSLKIKICIKILTIKNVFVLKMFVNILSKIRKIYRKMRLG